MIKCERHMWDDSFSDYCHRCEEENKKNMNTIELPQDSVTSSVMKDLKSRSDLGVKKYKTTLGANDHQNMLQHAYEEALDLAQYLKKEVTTLNTIQDMIKQFPNDQQLGEEIRKKYSQK